MSKTKPPMEFTTTVPGLSPATAAADDLAAALAPLAGTDGPSAAPAPPSGVIAGAQPAPAKALEVGDAVKVWPHAGDRGCFSAPHTGVVTAVHMNDCVDAKATVVEGKREYERTFVGLVLVGSRGRERGDAGTFTVGG